MIVKKQICGWDFYFVVVKLRYRCNPDSESYGIVSTQYWEEKRFLD